MSHQRATGEYEHFSDTQVINTLLPRCRFVVDLCKRDGVEDPKLAAKVLGFEEGWEATVVFKPSETRASFTAPSGGKKIQTMPNLASALEENHGDGTLPWGCQKDCPFTKAEARKRFAQLRSGAPLSKGTAAKEEPKAKQEPKVKQEAGEAKPAKETKDAAATPQKTVKAEPAKEATKKETPAPDVAEAKKALKREPAREEARTESKVTKRAEAASDVGEARKVLKREQKSPEDRDVPKKALKREDAAPAARRPNGSGIGSSASTSAPAAASASTSSAAQDTIASDAPPSAWMVQPWVKVPHPRYQGIFYYFNEDTEMSVWDRPQGAPE